MEEEVLGGLRLVAKVNSGLVESSESSERASELNDEYVMLGR